MSRLISSKRRPAVLAVPVLLFACLALAACGGSSSASSSSSKTASTSTSASAAGGPGGPAGAKRFTAMRECLQKNGITLPKRTPGKRPPAGGGGFLGGGGAASRLPKGVTRAQYEAAIKKCGGLRGGRPGTGGGQRVNSPAFKQALTKFAACMGENGVNVPTPNTSGKGPIFNTKGLDTTSAKFKAAEAKCSGVLRSAFKARPGTAGGATPPASSG